MLELSRSIVLKQLLTTHGIVIFPRNVPGLVIPCPIPQHKTISLLKIHTCRNSTNDNDESHNPALLKINETLSSQEISPFRKR